MKKKREPVEPLVLDVRPILAGGGSPCEPIEQAVATLKPEQNLILMVPFEPVPLYAKLAREGFSHVSRQLSDGVWRVEFQRDKKTVDTSASTKPGSDSAANVLLDNRGLEPPEPLVRTLEALGRIASGGKMTMLSDRKPLHLFEELEARGFHFDCTEQGDHSFVTSIWQSQDS